MIFKDQIQGIFLFHGQKLRVKSTIPLKIEMKKGLSHILRPNVIILYYKTRTSCLGSHMWQTVALAHA